MLRAAQRLLDRATGDDLSARASANKSSDEGGFLRMRLLIVPHKHSYQEEPGLRSDLVNCSGTPETLKTSVSQEVWWKDGDPTMTRV